MDPISTPPIRFPLRNGKRLVGHYRLIPELNSRSQSVLRRLPIDSVDDDRFHRLSAAFDLEAELLFDSVEHRGARAAGIYLDGSNPLEREVINAAETGQVHDGRIAEVAGRQGHDLLRYISRRHVCTLGGERGPLASTK